MNITETVVDVQSKKTGTICEIRLEEGGKDYLVDFDGAKIWKRQDEIVVYLTSEHTNTSGEYLLD
jgi:hypothetical protein